MAVKPTTVPGLKRMLIHWCHKVWERGWVANHDGNLSCRLPGKRILATPTSFSKGEIREDDLLVLNHHGKKLQGRWRVFSELDLHQAAYTARADATAVLHAHPPTATGFSVAGVEVETAILAEAVVSLGAAIPTLPFEMPRSETQVERIIRYLQHYDAIILKNHGVLTIGKDIEQAYLRMELVEHLAKIKQVALQVGQVDTLTAHQVEMLLRKRSKAGLGAEGRGVLGPPPTD
jgi:L-fuculose-phosphate aldolase